MRMKHACVGALTAFGALTSFADVRADAKSLLKHWSNGLIWSSVTGCLCTQFECPIRPGVPLKIRMSVSRRAAIRKAGIKRFACFEYDARVERIMPILAKGPMKP